MADTTMTDAARLAELERQLAQLTATQQAERDAAIRRQKHLERIPGSPDAELKHDSYAAAQGRIQQARRDAANEAMALRQKTYDAQLSRNAGAIEKVEGEIRALDGQERAERGRYDAAVAKLEDKRKGLRTKLNKLMEMPELPAVEPAYSPDDVDLILNFGRPVGAPRLTPEDFRIVAWVDDMGRKQPVTAEAARWPRPEGGMNLPAGVWLPFARAKLGPARVVPGWNA